MSSEEVMAMMGMGPPAPPPAPRQFIPVSNSINPNDFITFDGNNIVFNDNDDVGARLRKGQTLAIVFKLGHKK